MEYRICTVPAAPVRKEAAHRSEMTSQLLFGETMELLGVENEWLHIRSIYDGYEGWLTHHLVEPVGDLVALSPGNFVATGLVNPVTFKEDLINVPMGASLTGFDPSTGHLWEDDYSYHGICRNTSDGISPDLLERTVQAWLNAPYLWGGRTFMGVDCSGFAQVVFKLLGIPLKRDAWQQAEQGESVALQDVQPSDLAFFHNDKGRVIHVGIMLNPQEIIHASGKVRIDAVDQDGIINVTTGKRSHRLHSVKRIGAIR
jgi:cell wall-associated NlpC family hydrolase